MRKLTVKRKWSLVECASRIRLYIQCPADIASCTIGDKFYREYPLKNGKSVTADILDEPTGILIESSTMQTFYTVPEGNVDLTLIAKPHYNLAQGNPFTFSDTDGNVLA